MDKKSLKFPQGVLMYEIDINRNLFSREYKPIYPAIVLDGISSRTVTDLKTLERWISCFLEIYLRDIHYYEVKTFPSVTRSNSEPYTIVSLGYTVVVQTSHPTMNIPKDIQLSFLIRDE